MNSLIPMRPDETDYAHLVQTDRAHTSLYTDAKILTMKCKKSTTAHGYGWRMPVKFRKAEVTKPLISVNNPWWWYAIAKRMFMCC